MLIIKTSAVEVSIHATSPLLGCGAGAAVASAFFSSALTDSVTVAAFASAFVVSVAVVGGAGGLSCATVGAISPRALTSASNAKTLFMASPLQRLRADFAGADADDLLEVEHEDLPVADLAGVRRLLDRLDHLLEHVAFDRGFDLDLGQEVDHVLGPTIELRVALLPPEALDLGDRDPLHADARQRLAHLVELERLDDGRNEFHGNPLANIGAVDRRESPLRGDRQNVLPTESTSPKVPTSRTVPAPFTAYQYFLSASVPMRFAPSSQPARSYVTPTL